MKMEEHFSLRRNIMFHILYITLVYALLLLNIETIWSSHFLEISYVKNKRLKTIIIMLKFYISICILGQNVINN